MSDLVFAEKKKDAFTHGSWKVLVVDDDPGIHAITRTVLRDLVYDNRTLEFISAYSRAEAESLYGEHCDIALILLDVVMEEDDSGLKFVEYIRNSIGNTQVRIILRTGQPGKAPSQKVIVDYDINDYEEKTDLTAQKLFTSVIASLRNYRDIALLESNRASMDRHRAGLSRISESAGVLFGSKNPEEFTIGAYKAMLSVIHSEHGESTDSFAALQDGSDFLVIDAKGRYSGTEGREPRELIGETAMENLRSLRRDGGNLLVRDGAVRLYEDARMFRLLLHAENIGKLEVQDFQVLDIFASNVGVAFENLRLSREITGTQEELITRLGQVVETRSHESVQHVRRVGELCGMLAECAGMDEGAIHELKLASALHDIGKIGIPDDILLKPDVLNEEEFAIIRRHATIGWELLRKSSRPLLRKASVICHQHHEHTDGTGYPQGLKGPEIDLSAKIVAICDVFDSLTHGRLHREAWDVDRAASYIADLKGQAFDADLVELFLDNIDKAVAVNADFPN